MAEEAVNNQQEQPTPVVTDSQPDLSAQLKEANERAAKAELLAEQEKNRAEEMTKQFNNAKSKIGQYYDDRKQALEDQGAYKPLWEEANKTNQDLQAKIAQLEQENQDIKTSNDRANTRQTALAAISNLGAINAEQTLSLIESKLQKNAQGEVVVLEGGVEHNLTAHLTGLKNPGSGWEHHFKASSAAGMGAKPSPVGSAGGNINNPYKSKNITEQLIMEAENPDLAAVLKAEAQ
tara:strand:- start:1098 stop:1802 length:705 start_codon:yes stop_codon:yes gene_type:complete